MAGRIPRKLNLGRKLFLMVSVAWAVVSIFFAVLNTPLSRAESQVVATTPQFEVASIKPCKVANNRGRGGGGGGIPAPPAGRLQFHCISVIQLIRDAYVNFANGQRNSGNVPISGAPAWITSFYSDLYDIDAKAEGNPSQEMMRGPMLQSLLEDRFKLKIHRETREVPVYVMTVAKGGLKLHQLEAGGCDPVDLTKPPRPRPTTPDGIVESLQPGQKPTCGLAGHSSKGPNDSIMTVLGQAMSLSEFSKLIVFDVGRPVIDKTGITGIFDFRLRYAVDQLSRVGPRGGANAGGIPPTAPSDPAGGPTIFTAIQEQLGLNLESSRGPGEFLVIDSVERPTEN